MGFKKVFCCEKKSVYLQNMKTLEKVYVRCNTYACPDCGPVKAWRLKKALQKFLSQWKHIRFWTFTLQHSEELSIGEHWKLLSECWRRFTTYIRRCRYLKESYRKFQYVKVFEAHKDGYLHIHAFISEYMPYSVVQPIWESICQRVLGRKTHCGQAFVKGLVFSSQAARYVSKYVLKLAQELSSSIRRYSKSSKIALFDKKGNKSGDWVYINENLFVVCNPTANEVLEKFKSSLLVPNKSNFTVIEAEFDSKLKNRLEFDEDG